MLRLLLFCTFLLTACRREDRDGAEEVVTVPAHFPAPVYNYATAPLQTNRILLGKALFYDTRLSSDGHVSCGSCHMPQAAFTTFEHDRSHGPNNSHTLRNAPALQNLAWVTRFGWDGAHASLKGLMKAHMASPTHLGQSTHYAIAVLQRDTKYQPLLKKAYGDDLLTEDRFWGALEQFLLSLVSANTKYDRIKNGRESFTPTEAEGYALFQTKCATCHAEPLFTAGSYRNTGIPPDPALGDLGRFFVSSDPVDSFRFRVPSLRNVGFSGYYGHDGRYPTLRQAIQHYRTGITPMPNIDPAVRGGIPLSDAEVNAVVAFMRTLNDTSFVNNQAHR